MQPDIHAIMQKEINCVRKGKAIPVTGREGP
jgi:hypothetical protein